MGCRKPLYLPSHVRLIGVLRLRRETVPCQAPLNAYVIGEIQKALETQHGLKRLRAIPNRRRKPALEMTAAESDPPTKLSVRASGPRNPMKIT